VLIKNLFLGTSTVIAGVITVGTLVTVRLGIYLVTKSKKKLRK